VSVALITQSDIAKVLKVSRITVSKALNDHNDISQKMKLKVRNTAKQLGYIPHFHAKNLHSNRTHTIGVVVPDVSNSFFSFAIHGILDAAKTYGYHIILTVSQEDAANEEENIMTLLSMRVDGLLVAISKETRDRKIFDIVKNTETALVLFDRKLPELEIPMVGIDDEMAAFQLVEHMIKAGYSSIGHISGSTSISIGYRRKLGYVKAMNLHGLIVNDDWIIEGGFSKKDGYTGMQTLLERGPLPEAIFMANDRIAQGAYMAIKEAGLNIPGDVGITAFGHSEFAQLLSPPLTIVHTSPDELGKRAMELLVDVIRGEKEIKLNNDLPFELQIRDSMRC
jgi:LacI family transcriptional regulator